MAEFQEVMRQWQRMCKSMQEKNMSCRENCLLGHNQTCGELEYASLEEINNAETVIMKWAAEHPMPVYPTFGELLEKQGVVKLVNSDRYEEDGRKVYILLESVENQIPADIAQKLGIEPKEG